MATDKYKVVSPWYGSPHKKGAVITEAEAGADIGNLQFIGAVEPVAEEKAASSTSAAPRSRSRSKTAKAARSGSGSGKAASARGTGGRFASKSTQAAPAAPVTEPVVAPAPDNGAVVQG